MNAPEQPNEIKIIGKDEFYKNKNTTGLFKPNEPFLNENINKSTNFFDNFDYSRINERSLSTNEKLPNLLENIKLNNNVFDFGLINKKVNYKKKEKMKSTRNSATLATEKVIPFIGSNIDNLLLHKVFLKNDPPCNDLLDCDSILANNNNSKKIVIGHKRTKTLYRFNKNMKVVKFNRRYGIFKVILFIRCWMRS